MDIIKVKIPVGSNGLVKKAFLVNSSGQYNGVGCAAGCIKIELDKNMMDQIRSFEVSMNRKYTFTYSRTHLPHGKIPVDIIPGKTDPYLIVEEPGDFFWVGNVNDQQDWTPEENQIGQYEEKVDGTGYKLIINNAETVSPNRDTDFDEAEMVSKPRKPEEEEWREYPKILSRKSSVKWNQRDDDEDIKAVLSAQEEDGALARKMGEEEDRLFARELQGKIYDIDARGNIRITKKRRHKKRDKKSKKKPVRKRGKKKSVRKRGKKKPARKKPARKKPKKKRQTKKSVRKIKRRKN